MATLRNSRLLLNLVKQSRRHLLSSNRQLSTTPVLCADWNKDWKPAPIPRTPEERAAAAKKYGLRPEDYTALTDGDADLGDYPNLPAVAKSWKDPFEDWDFPDEKRNYGEPIHPDAEIIGQNLYGPKAGGYYTYWQNLGLAVLTLCGFISAFWLFEPYPLTQPRMPRQYPFNDLYLENGGDPDKEPTITHYTFSPPQC